MSTCPECGTQSPPDSQCSQCGAYVAGAALLEPVEIDDDALARNAMVGGSAPTAAQIDGTAGEGALELAESPRRPRRTTSSLAREIEGGFGERARERRTLFWRATRVPVLVILGWFTVSHLFFDSKWVFLDGVNLLLHEAGHVIWGWGSHSQAALGGTLGQLMWPAIFAAYFRWWQSDRFALWCCVWWFGQNFMSISHYMNDAAAMQLPLIGGDQHDWNYLFKHWHVIDKTNEIARFFHGLGGLIMALTLAWLVWRTLHPDRHDIDELI